MSRQPLDLARVVRLAEESLYLVGEQREFLTDVSKLELILVGLDESDKLDQAVASADVEQAKTNLRAACARLEEIERRNQEKRRLRTVILQRFEAQKRELTQVSRTISRDASDVGVKHMRPDLVGELSPAEVARV